MIRPKLVVTGAAAAIDFYARAFGATVVQRVDAGGTVVFAELALLGDRITLKDADDVDAAVADGHAGVLIDVVNEHPDEVVERAVAAGAEVVFAVRDADYGARGGRIRDPYGHQWLIQTPTPAPVDDAVQEAIDGLPEG